MDNNSTNHSTRRDFLKTSATTGAVLARLSLGQSVHAQGKEEIKIGMLGCGGRYGRAAMQADLCVKLVAVSDVFENRVKGQRNSLAQANPEQVDCPDDRCFWDFEGYKKVIRPFLFR